MTHEKMPEALQDMKRRAIVEKDSNGVMGQTWATPKEVLSLIAEIERLREEVDGLRSVAFDLNHALIGAITQLHMAGDCVESCRYDEALLHTRSLPREKREAIEHYAAMQSTQEKQ